MSDLTPYGFPRRRRSWLARWFGWEEQPKPRGIYLGRPVHGPGYVIQPEEALGWNVLNVGPPGGGKSMIHGLGQVSQRMALGHNVLVADMKPDPILMNVCVRFAQQLGFRVKVLTNVTGYRTHPFDLFAYPKDRILLRQFANQFSLSSQIAYWTDGYGKTQWSAKDMDLILALFARHGHEIQTPQDAHRILSDHRKRKTLGYPIPDRSPDLVRSVFALLAEVAAFRCRHAAPEYADRIDFGELLGDNTRPFLMYLVPDGSNDPRTTRILFNVVRKSLLNHLTVLHYLGRPYRKTAFYADDAESVVSSFLFVRDLETSRHLGAPMIVSIQSLEQLRRTEGVFASVIRACALRILTDASCMEERKLLEELMGERWEADGQWTQPAPWWTNDPDVYRAAFRPTEAYSLGLPPFVDPAAVGRFVRVPTYGKNDILRYSADPKVAWYHFA